MKFERSELGALFSKLRTAVPEVRAVGTDDAGILLSGSNAYATNLELSVRAGLSKPVEQDVVVLPRGVDFISGTVAPEISIEADKGILTVKSGTARARLNTTPAENYPEFSGPGNDAKRCIVGANDLSWAISKVLYAVSKDENTLRTVACASLGKARMCWKSVRWMDTGWRLPESIAQLMVIFALRFLRPRQRQLIRFLWMVAWKLCVTGKRLFSVTAISR